MDLTGSTAWYASQTFWGSIAAIFAGAGGAYAGFKNGDIQAVTTSLTAVFGGIVAVIGRFKAEKPLGSKSTPSVAEKVAAKVGENVDDKAVQKAASQVVAEAATK